MLHQRMRLVLRNHADASNAGVNAVRQGEINNAEFAAEVNRWFGARGGQISQARAASACQNEGYSLRWQLSRQHQVFGTF